MGKPGIPHVDRSGQQVCGHLRRISLAYHPVVPRMTSHARKPRDERRAELLAAAQVVFVASGYHAASMDDIADHAGVSKPVLYQHFPGKLYLYVALLDGATTRLISRIDEALAAVDPDAGAGAGLAAVIGAYFAFVADPNGDFRLVFGGDRVNDAIVHERLRRLDDSLTERIAGLLAQDAALLPPGHTAGDSALPTSDALLVAAGLLGMAQRAAAHWLATEDGREASEVAASIIANVAWRGLWGLSHSRDSTRE